MEEEREENRPQVNDGPADERGTNLAIHSGAQSEVVPDPRHETEPQPASAPETVPAPPPPDTETRPPRSEPIPDRFQEPEPVPAPRRSESLDRLGDSVGDRPASDEMATRTTSSSERLRATVNLVPPDRKPPSWWRRHRYTINAVEWFVAVALIVVSLYYLWFLVFAVTPPAPVTPPPPSREEFRARLRELRSMKADPAWKVDAAIGRWRRIVIHHTATEFGNPEVFDRYHRENNKWPNGLGYHFVIGNGNGMEDGEVAIGPRWLKQQDGAHVKGPEKDNANSYSIGIALVGDFEKTMATPRQLAALRGLLAFLRTEYNVGLAAIVGHNAVSATRTACPGEWFFVDEVVLVVANPEPE